MKKSDERIVKHKIKVLNYADEIGHVTQACRYFGISRDTFYRWRRQYTELGEEGLINSKPCPENPSIRVAPIIEEKILYLRKKLFGITANGTGLLV